MKTLITLLFGLGLLISLSSFADKCETYEVCHIQKKCSCTITPSSAFNRHFYFKFISFSNNKKYQCSFNAFPSRLHIEQNESYFPCGSEVKCHGSCPYFPLDLEINTSHMREESGLAVVKYFVPASDIPVVVTAECKLIS